jgi:hypothetical protein
MADMTEQAHTPRNKGGRPSKGDREELKTRVPTPLARLVKADAKARGLRYTDHLAEILADHYRLQLEAKSA